MTTLENGSNHECIPDSCSACGKLFSTRFQMTREEAIALYNLLKAEWIPRDDNYEILTRLINGIANFIDETNELSGRTIR